MHCNLTGAGACSCKSHDHKNYSHCDIDTYSGAAMVVTSCILNNNIILIIILLSVLSKLSLVRPQAPKTYRQEAILMGVTGVGRKL